MSEYNSELERAILLLQDVAFLVIKGGNEQKVHGLVVDAMLCIKNAMNVLATNIVTERGVSMNKENIELNEIKKVCRKLLKWAKSPEQINAKILTTFLELEEQSNGNITVKQFENAVKSKYEIKFANNYNQMKNIGEKNHGKVFEERDGRVYIWDKVKEYINKYKQAVLRR